MSSAERVGRAGHGQLIATPLTLALLGAEVGHLGVPLHRRFTLGTMRLELIGSGHGPGAAALHVDNAGHSVLYAGAIRSDAAEAAEVRACHAVVVAAPFGDDRHRFPKLATVIAQVIEWTRAQLAVDKRPVLLVDSALEGLEVVTSLATAGIAVAGARAIREAARRAAEVVQEVALAGRAVGDPSATATGAPRGDARLGPVPAPGREPRAIVWLDSDRAGLARSLADRAYTTALVSGRALDGAAGADAAFAWTSAAGRAELLAWIETTSAREVYVTGACAETIAAALGSRARVIGPPHQMALFPREAAP
ncbi:MAG: hypothetical protein ABI867_37050 [Kofleriaceae bacterium]